MPHPIQFDELTPAVELLANQSFEGMTSPILILFTEVVKVERTEEHRTDAANSHLRWDTFREACDDEVASHLSPGPPEKGNALFHLIERTICDVSNHNGSPDCNPNFSSPDASRRRSRTVADIFRLQGIGWLKRNSLDLCPVSGSRRKQAKSR
jgi:hypothetical protein